MSVMQSLQNYIGKLQVPLFLGAALVFSALIFLVSQWLADPEPTDLSESPFALTTQLLREWQSGDVIVLVRHLERCSRVEAACLGESSGITQRAAVTGLALRKTFANLGLSSTDVYGSPLLRTSQTSELLFAEPTANEDFLYQCQESFVQDALAKKIPGRNLVLVTHSSCMDEVNASLNYGEVDYEYGAAVFLRVESATQQQILGFVDANDWSKTLRPRS